jgi:hypothetical protein
LTYFRRGIAIDPKAIQAWFYSFQTLKLLGRTSDRRKLIEDFLHDRPEFADLPMFQDRER